MILLSAIVGKKVEAANQAALVPIPAAPMKGIGMWQALPFLTGSDHRFITLSPPSPPSSDLAL